MTDRPPKALWSAAYPPMTTCCVGQCGACEMVEFVGKVEQLQ